jgi:hypothetical protein
MSDNDPDRNRDHPDTTLITRPPKCTTIGCRCNSVTHSVFLFQGRGSHMNLGLVMLMVSSAFLMNAESFRFLMVVFLFGYNMCLIPLYLTVLIPRVLCYFVLAYFSHFCFAFLFGECCVKQSSYLTYIFFFPQSHEFLHIQLFPLFHSWVQSSWVCSVMLYFVIRCRIIIPNLFPILQFCSRISRICSATTKPLLIS